MVGSTVVDDRDRLRRGGPGRSRAGLVPARSRRPTTSRRCPRPARRGARRSIRRGRLAVYWAGTVRPTRVPASRRTPAGSSSATGARPARATDGAAPTPLTGRPGRRSATRRRSRPAGWTTGTRAGTAPAPTSRSGSPIRRTPRVGRLSLYAVDSFDGRIDLKKPLLDAHVATAGYSISDGKLVWAEPAADGSATGGKVQLLRLDGRRRRDRRDRHRTGDRHPLIAARAALAFDRSRSAAESLYRPVAYVRPSRMVAGAALTAALALGALPGIAGSAGPTPASVVDPSTFQSVQVPAFASTELAVEPLDGAFRAAGAIDATKRPHRARQGAEADRPEPADRRRARPPHGGSAQSRRATR